MKILEFYDRSAPKLLQEGQIIAFPTETVFGLGVRYDDKKAYEYLVKVKRRPPEKPFTLMGGDNIKIEDYAEVTPAIQRVIEAFMPGPLTLLLQPRPDLPDYLTIGSGKVGIRISGDKRVRDLIDETGVPLLVPSANRSGEEPAHSDKEVASMFEGEIAACIKGVCYDSQPSTIVDLSDDGEVVLIRAGEINLEDIKEIYYR